jgi:hypothetical protein
LQIIHRVLFYLLLDVLQKFEVRKGIVHAVLDHPFHEQVTELPVFSYEFDWGLVRLLPI